ncbi:hypothetical protein BJV82DRAFT_628327 [Fennellomyces sp. T-0311]|nr:hypothetical protein BJV82DRAFT_628327 [Fennellomyces sp. T-0311]
MSNNDNAFINWILTHDPELEFAGSQQQPPATTAGSSGQIALTNPELLPYILGDTTPSATPSVPNYPLLPSTLPSDTAIPATIPTSVSPTAVAGASGDSHSDETKSTITFGGSSGGHKHRSDDEEDYLSESQLKMMTSKERRQLRNKISARKFRNRRKEYISMLEAEVQKQKAENNQLRLEVTWIRSTADKLQKENDQLRLELVLCKEGIQPRRRDNSNGSNAIVPAAITVPSYNRTASLSPPSLGNSSFNDTGFIASDSSSTSSSNNNPSPPEMPVVDQWELVFNDNSQHPPPPPSSHHHQTYLSHAVMPDWDLREILRKEKDEPTPANQLFYKYPLLAPALMSIVLGHTMTMTTKDLVANAKLLPPLPEPLEEDLPRFLANDLWFGPKLSTRNKHVITGEEFRSMWEAQMFQFDSLDDWHPDDNDKSDPNARQLPRYCPLNWLQRQFCSFMYDYVIARYPELETPCHQYLPMCDKFRRQITMA